MPRDLPISNGRLLVAFGSAYQLRELYFPHVGQANHTLGHPSRFGVWVDGEMAWIDDPAWERALAYEPDTLVTHVQLLNRRMGLALTAHDCVDISSNVYLRRLEIEDLGGGPRDLRLFFHHDLHIGGSGEGVTAYYHPGHERALVHYKGHHWFLADAAVEGGPWGFASYATGVTRHHGSEGTWRDAEDGSLERNAIAQGSVDSTGAVHVRLDGRATVHYWIAAGESAREVMALNDMVRTQGPEAILRRVRAYWRQWVARSGPHDGLPESLAVFYRRSLLILRTQIDHGGAILAANDSDALSYNRDSYSYLWPRDGALVAEALDLAGYQDVSQRFYALSADLLTPHGYLMHKYNPDGSVGSSWHPWCAPDGSLQLPIQEDETALTLHGLREHYRRWGDVDFVRRLYAPLIEPAGEFLWGYRHLQTHLPDASWDLWEERRGIHLFTVASVWAGLNAAADFAAIFGDEDRAARLNQAAEEIRAATVQHLYDPRRRRFLRGLTSVNGRLEPDAVLDSSQCGVFLFGMFPPDDPRVVRTMEAIAEGLWCRTPVGGVARYAGDPYYRVTDDSASIPGNPWFLSTLWLAQWLIARAQTAADLARPRELLEWTASHAAPSGVLAEQVHPYTGEPLSVAPLTWSHATFVATARRWQERCQALGRPDPGPEGAARPVR